MPVNSRNKGRSFEQAVASDLREALGAEWIVMRNQTDRQRGQVGAAGEFSIQRLDVASGPRFPWCIECKAYGDWHEGQLWREPVVGHVVRWWEQASRQAASIQAAPMLICKRNRGEVLVIVRQADWIRALGSHTMLLQLGGEALLVMRWEHVVRWLR